MSAARITVSHQLSPAVAFAVRRTESAWLVVVNPGLIRADRVYVEALASQMIDNLEGGWEYQPPAGGVDVVVGARIAAVSRVVDPAGGGGREVAATIGRMAAVFALPLTACAWIAEHLAPLLLTAPGFGA